MPDDRACTDASSVFHSWQPGHWPRHCIVCAPHEEHIYISRIFAMFQAYGKSTGGARREARRLPTQPPVRRDKDIFSGLCGVQGVSCKNSKATACIMDARPCRAGPGRGSTLTGPTVCYRRTARTVAQKIPPRMAAALMPRRSVTASPIKAAPPRAVISGTLSCTTAAVGTLRHGSTEYHST